MGGTRRTGRAGTTVRFQVVHSGGRWQHAHQPRRVDDRVTQPHEQRNRHRGDVADVILRRDTVVGRCIVEHLEGSGAARARTRATRDTALATAEPERTAQRRPRVQTAVRLRLRPLEGVRISIIRWVPRSHMWSRRARDRARAAGYHGLARAPGARAQGPPPHSLGIPRPRGRLRAAALLPPRRWRLGRLRAPTWAPAAVFDLALR